MGSNRVTVGSQLPAGTNNIGDVDVLSLPAIPAGTNNIGDVDVLTLPGVAGDVAHDTADSGNPVKIGGKAIDVENMPTSVAAGDRVDAAYTDKGIAAVALFDPLTQAPLTNIEVASVDGGLSLEATQVASQAFLATIDADTNAIKTAVETIDNAISGSEMQVDVITLPAVTGTVTANAGTNLNTSALGLEATQAAGNVLTGAVAETAPASDTASSGLNGRLQRIAQRLTSLIAVFNIGAGTEAAAVRVTLPTDGTGKVGLNAGTNNIGDVDVLTLPALPAGTNNIGDVDVASIAAGDNNIGNVDVVTLPALVAGSANIGDVDVLTLPAAATGYVGDAAATATPTGIMEMGLAKAAAPTDVSADNDAVSGWRLRNGAAATVITAAGALIGGDATNGLDVDVTRLPALVAGSANIGDVDVLTVPADPFGVNADAASATGSISAKLRAIAATGIPITALPALVAGSAAIGKLAANSGVDIGDVDVTSLPNVTLAAGTNTNEIVGDVAEDIALAGNPVRQGVRASTAVPTAMSADGDVVTPWANRNGAQVVAVAPHIGLNGDPFSLLSETAQYTSAQTGVALVTPTGGKKLVVTKVQIGIGGTVAGTFILWFGASGDTTYTRGTDRAIFDHEFAPSATNKPGVVMDGPFIAGAADDILRVTGVGAINPQTVTVWYYEI